MKDDRIVGTLLVGKACNARAYSMLIKRKMDISTVRGVLLSDDFERAIDRSGGHRRKGCISLVKPSSP